MAVALDTATRVGPPGCGHYLAGVSADGRPVSVAITLAEINEPVTDEDLRATLKVWARYHRSRGVPLAQLVGRTIFGEVP